MKGGENSMSENSSIRDVDKIEVADKVERNEVEMTICKNDGTVYELNLGKCPLCGLTNREIDNLYTKFKVS